MSLRDLYIQIVELKMALNNKTIREIEADIKRLEDQLTKGENNE